jgi:hypothetical protein
LAGAFLAGTAFFAAALEAVFFTGAAFAAAFVAGPFFAGAAAFFAGGFFAAETFFAGAADFFGAAFFTGLIEHHSGGGDRKRGMLVQPLSPPRGSIG